MAMQTREELLASGAKWFDKLYVSQSPVFHQINARRPNNAPEFKPSRLLDKLETNGKDRLNDFDNAVDLMVKGT